MRIAPIAAAMLLVISSGAYGDYEYVGTGDKDAKVLLEFSDGAIYAFGVSFSDPNTTGIGLMDIIEAGTTLTTERQFYEGLGWMITGISYAGHGNSGYGGGELWWHYWVLDPPNDWESPWGYGAGGRTAADGCGDGWIYGRAGAPHLPGDTGGDLVVDGGDLAVMGGNWMTESGMAWADGDFTGDGAVNGGDLALMGGNWLFGSTPAPPASPVPEPATAMLLTAGLAALWRRRKT